MFNTSQLMCPFCFLHTTWQFGSFVFSQSLWGICLRCLKTNESFHRIAEGAAQSRYPGLREMLSKENPRAPISSPEATFPVTPWAFHQGTPGSEGQCPAMESSSCVISLSSLLKSPLLIWLAFLFGFNFLLLLLFSKPLPKTFGYILYLSKISLFRNWSSIFFLQHSLTQKRYVQMHMHM